MLGSWRLYLLRLCGWAGCAFGASAIYAGLRDGAGSWVGVGAGCMVLGVCALAGAQVMRGAGRWHSCDLPVLGKPLGAVFECRVCGAQWISDRVMEDGSTTEFAVWTRV